FSKSERCARVTGKYCAEQKNLCEPSSVRRFSVFSMKIEWCAVAQIIFEARQIFRRGNDQNLAETAEHKDRERVANHRLVVNWQQLFADDFRQRKQARPRATGEKNGFLVHEGILPISRADLIPSFLPSRNHGDSRHALRSA